MKRKKKIIGQKKMFAYFLFAIVVPSLVLGIMAFRGIKNDKALVEKQNREQAEEIGNLIIQKSDDYISKIENNFLEKTSTTGIPQHTYFTDTILEKFTANHPIILGIFFIDSNGNAKLMKSNLQYLPNDYTFHQKIQESSNDKLLLEKGWTYEFQLNDLHEALLFYTSIIPVLSNDFSKAKALNIIARLQKKLQLTDSAIKTYRIIIAQFSHIYIGNTLPIALAAKSELGQLYLQNKDTLNAISISLELYSDLIDRKWALHKTNYMLFMSRNALFLEGLKIDNDLLLENSRKQTEILEHELGKLQIQTSTLIFLKNNPDEIIFSKLNRFGGSNYKKKYRFPQDLSGNHTMVSVLIDSSDIAYCLLLDSEILKIDLLTSELFKSFDQKDWKWQLLDQEDNIISSSGIATERASFTRLSFPSHLPRWTLLLFLEPSSLTQSFLESSQSINFYIFIFIVLVLLFGLFFTMQTINHELEVTKMKSNFIDTVSHEFKSPLTSIRHMLEMLNEDRVPSLRRQFQYYKSMQHQTERLSHLIDNIMNFSTLEKGLKKFHFEETDISEFIKGIKTEFHDSVFRNKIQLNFNIKENLSPIHIDRESMEQVFMNLIDNAIKYSGKGKTVVVNIEVIKGNLSFSVKDNGIGIPIEVQDKIFERFYRVDNHLIDHIKGTGIGLGIVKEIVSAHGGHISVESKPGFGSNFQVTIPTHQTL